MLPALKPRLPAQPPAAQPAPQDPTSAGVQSSDASFHICVWSGAREHAGQFTMIKRRICGSTWITSDMRGHSERPLAHEWQELGRSLHFASRRRARSLLSVAVQRAQAHPHTHAKLVVRHPLGAQQGICGDPRQIYSMSAGGADGESSSEPRKTIATSPHCHAAAATCGGHGTHASAATRRRRR